MKAKNGNALKHEEKAMKSHATHRIRRQHLSANLLAVLTLLLTAALSGQHTGARQVPFSASNAIDVANGLMGWDRV